MTRQFLLYGVSGAIALATHLAVLAILVEVFDAAKLVATTIGFIAAVPVHYVIQRKIVFGSKRDARIEFGRYVAVTIATMALNAGLFEAIYSFTAPYYLVTQVAVTTLVFVCNFFVNRHVTFAHGSRVGKAPPGSGEDKEALP